jgi:hypothetical protein
MTSYLDSVRSFDHRELAELPSYARLRQALSDVLNEAGEHGCPVPLAELSAVAADMALIAPYADCCDRCHGRSLAAHCRASGNRPHLSVLLPGLPVRVDLPLRGRRPLRLLKLR